MADLRHLIVVLGDQLDLDATAFDGFDATVDAVWMAEVAEESTHVWSGKPRTALFLAAMRHFALALKGAGRPLHYTRLDAPDNAGSLPAQLLSDVQRLRPAALVMTAPGDSRFASHPGRLDSCAWPETRAQALQAMQAFIIERLPLFGRYQDAMWPGDPWLYHAHLSAALNLKLLNPREVVAQAQAAYHDGQAPLASVEGFIRQILGWREYVRGVYWTQMPGYLERNALGATEDLPAWYWTGATDMACPFTTLYWDFLLRHQALLASNPRMALQVKNVARLTDAQQQAVRARAEALRRGEVGEATGGGAEGAEGLFAHV
ncbi:MAG: hypothetical protein RIS90_725 [Pseudomonadota bacterium]